MTAYPKIAAPVALWIAAFLPLAGGCCGLCSCFENKNPTPPLGVQSDGIWRRQEAGASASDFVIYQHEFEADSARLNSAGGDHLKSIAARLHAGAPLPVIVERSMTTVRPDSEYHYPVHPNSELDMKRRASVVGSLAAMGITNAEQCVVVSPAIAEGYTATQAVRAYNRGINRFAPGYGYNGAAAPGTSGAVGGGSFPSIYAP